MSTLARVFVVSQNVESYADACTALVSTYNPGKIEISFLEAPGDPKQPKRGDGRSSFVTAIREKINEVSEFHEAYRLCKSTPIIEGDGYSPEELSALIENSDLIDVTGVPKDLVAALVAESIMGSGVPILTVRWIGKISQGTRNRIGSSPYKYQNLCDLPRVQKLRQVYRQKSNLIIVFFAAIFVIVLLSALSLFFPSLVIVKEILNPLSLMLSVAGLLIAVSEKNNIGLMKRPKRRS